MFEELFPEKGVARRSYSDLNIVIICKQDEEGSRKAIFIPRLDILFLYIDRLETIEGVDYLVLGSGGAASLNKDFLSIDISVLSLTPQIINDISPFLDGEAFLTIASASGGFPTADPPIGQFRLSFGSGGLEAIEEPINYGAGAFTYSAVHRGFDRDFAYSTDELIFGNFGPASIWSRIRDVDFEWYKEFDLPDLDTATVPPYQMAWPSIGIDNEEFDPYFRVVGNKVYITGWIEGTFGTLYKEFWRFDADLFSFTWLFSHNGYLGGGLSENWLNNFVLDYVGTKMGYSSSQRFDAAGAISDTEHVYVSEEADPWYPAMLTPLFSFNSGDYFGYAGRTAEGRLSHAWYVGTISDDMKEVYAVQVENFTSATKDGVVLRYLDADDIEVFETVYTPPDGYWLRGPIVDPYNPRLVLVGEQSYSDSNLKRSLLIDVVNKSTSEVTGEYSNFINRNTTFVR